MPRLPVSAEYQEPKEKEPRGSFFYKFFIVFQQQIYHNAQMILARNIPPLFKNFAKAAKKNPCAFSLTATAATFFFTEPFLYNLSETENGENILCNIDMTCRKMAPEDIERAQEIFGDTIDYDRIIILSRPPLMHWASWLLDSPYAAIAFYNAIYEFPAFHETSSETVKNAIHIHELHHIWQNQNVFEERGLKKTRAHDNLYAYDINEFETFLEFGIEQQATMVQMVYSFQNILAGNTGLEHAYENDHIACEKLNEVENIVAQTLPVKITDCSEHAPNVPKI